MLIRWVAAGLCHSDEHLRHGDIVPRFPIVGGHEGAGDHREGRPGRHARQAEGDHVVTSFLPVCGHCRFCATGHSNICDLGATILDGCLPDGTFRFHDNGDDVGAHVHARHASASTRRSPRRQLRQGRRGPAARDRRAGRLRRPHRLVLAVYAADVVPGETVIIYGIGGIGANAVQGAAHAGAANIIAVDPLANKREMAEDLGATHSVASAEEAHELAQELTRGVGADKAIITVDIVNEEVVGAAVDAIRKGGTAVITGLADPNKVTVQLSGAVMTLYEKTVKGTLFGSGNPMHDIRNLIGLYQAGKLKLDELITNTLHARRHQPGLPGHARRQEHPGRGRSTTAA